LVRNISMALVFLFASMMEAANRPSGVKIEPE